MSLLLLLSGVPVVVVVVTDLFNKIVVAAAVVIDDGCDSMDRALAGAQAAAKIDVDLIILSLILCWCCKST